MINAWEIEEAKRQQKAAERAAMRSYANMRAIPTANGYTFSCTGCSSQNDKNGCYIGKEWPKELIEGKESLIKCYGVSEPFKLEDPKTKTFRAALR